MQSRFKECMNRNRMIAELIKYYQQKYQQYCAKPMQKRNKDKIDYQPTVNVNNPITEKQNKKNSSSTGKGIINDNKSINVNVNLKNMNYTAMNMSTSIAANNNNTNININHK